MKSKKLWATLAIALTLGCASGVYAANNNNSNSYKTETSQCRYGKGAGFKRITNKSGYDYVFSVLKNKFKISDEEILKARESGKSMHELVEEKGINLEDFKKALLEEKSKSIDEAINSGKITKEQGESIKNKINTNMNNCNGEGKKMGKGFSMRNKK